MSYTLDVWGQNRRTVESLQAQADNQRFLVEAAYLTLSSNVVVAAIQEASLRGQIEATNELIAINSKMLEVMRRQFMEGYANRNDVALQEAQLAQTKATLPPLRKALAQQRDLITALAGRFPSQEPMETFKLAGLLLPTELPVSLPSQLVEQRPDVRSSEELLRSASAQVGVAIANMLPSLTLSPNLGYTSTQLAQLITPQTLFWTLAGNATHTVFDGFTLFHTERAAEAALDAAVATHRNTVITAFQNVADALRAIQNDADALKAVDRIRARRQDQPRSRAAADAKRQRQLPGPAHRANQPINRRGSRWFKRRPPACPTPPRCSWRWAAAGGIASTFRPWKPAIQSRPPTARRSCLVPVRN